MLGDDRGDKDDGDDGDEDDGSLAVDEAVAFRVAALENFVLESEICSTLIEFWSFSKAPFICGTPPLPPSPPPPPSIPFIVASLDLDRFFCFSGDVFFLLLESLLLLLLL